VGKDKEHNRQLSRQPGGSKQKEPWHGEAGLLQHEQTGERKKVTLSRERVVGLGFWVLGFGFWVLGFGFWVLGLKFLVLGLVFPAFYLPFVPTKLSVSQFSNPKTKRRSS
jgi:hypothetical protein